MVSADHRLTASKEPEVVTKHNIAFRTKITSSADKNANTYINLRHIKVRFQISNSSDVP